ncbi:YdcF family protein [Baaleninema sp.]|uniref:YdcF family protein n=1 Tax=Baaleninema sp. TaxID=3101197 RepID=UPI003CFF8892
MFLVLTRVLLWLLVLVIAFYVFLKIVPKAYFTFLGSLAVTIFIVLVWFDPSDRTATIAWSILSLPFQPVGLIWLLLAQSLKGIKGAAISSTARNQIYAAFALFWLLSTPVVSEVIYQKSIERNAVQLLETTEGDTADTIVLIAQQTVEPQVLDRQQIQLSGNGNLIAYTAQLYNNSGASRVIISAGQRYDFPREVQEDETSEAEVVRDLLVQRFGLPQDRLIVEDTAQNLRQSVLAVSQLIEDNNFEPRLFVVTSALSLYRAITAFAAEDIEVIPRPGDFVTFEPSNPDRLDVTLASVVPSARGLTLSTQLANEYLTTLYYFLRGWLAPAEFVCLQCRENGLKTAPFVEFELKIAPKEPSGQFTKINTDLR